LNIPGQPQQVVWMQRPSVPGCPPGMEYLTQIDQLLIKQQVELLESRLKSIVLNVVYYWTRRL